MKLPIGSIQISKTSFPDSCLSVPWLSSILSVSIWGEEGLMRVQLAQQVQELVGTSELVITLADGIWPANAFERVVDAPVGLLLDCFNHGHGACVHRLGRAKLSC